MSDTVSSKRYVNVYADGVIGSAYTSEKQARACRSSTKGVTLELDFDVLFPKPAPAPTADGVRVIR